MSNFNSNKLSLINGVMDNILEIIENDPDLFYHLYMSHDYTMRAFESCRTDIAEKYSNMYYVQISNMLNIIKQCKIEYPNRMLGSITDFVEELRRLLSITREFGESISS